MATGWMTVRKKPIIVKAISVERANLDILSDISSVTYINSHTSEGIIGKIETLEGELSFSEADLIMEGTDGEHYPIKRDIFAKTYEIVERKTA